MDLLDGILVYNLSGIAWRRSDAWLVVSFIEVKASIDGRYRLAMDSTVPNQISDQGQVSITLE